MRILGDSKMNIKVRQATQGDAIFLTSISFGAKRDKDYAGDDIRKWYDKLKVTEEYIEKNTVFIAEDEHILLGYCAIRKLEKAELVDGLKLKEGYWLEYIFVKPECTSKGIGHCLFNAAKEYCKEQDIAMINILCEEEIRAFFERVGATFTEKLETSDRHAKLYEYQYAVIEKGSEQVAIGESEEVEFKELSKDEVIERNWREETIKQEEPDVKNEQEKQADDLSESKIPYRETCNWEELDGEEQELESLYDDEKLEDEDYENEGYEDEELEDRDYEDESHMQNDNVYTQIDKEEENQNKPTEEDQNEFAERLNYDKFLKSTVDIGYKFECEEIAEKVAKAEEKKKKINYTEVIEEIKEEEPKVAEESLQTTQENVEQPIGFEPLTKAELEILVGNAKGEVKEETEPKQILSIEKKGMEKVNQGEQQLPKEGQLYIAWGDEMANSRKRAANLLKEFNSLEADELRTAYSILEQLLGRIGESIHIEPNFHCSYGYNISVGESFCAGYNCVILDEAKVTIGDNCIISPQVGIYTQGYPTDVKKRKAGYEYAKPINIGNNVWIGGNSVINPGVNIGNNVVIQAGSVVLEDIPDNVVAGGNPAKIIRKIE